jgi:hypothetical protein
VVGAYLLSNVCTHSERLAFLHALLLRECCATAAAVCHSLTNGPGP